MRATQQGGSVSGPIAGHRHLVSRWVCAVVSLSVLVILGLGRAGLRAQQQADKKYFLSPTSDAPEPDEQILAKVSPQADSFTAEAYSERVLAKLKEFGRLLEESPANAARLQDLLAAEFRGTELFHPEETLREQGPLQVFRGLPSHDLQLDRDRFAAELRSFLSAYLRILAAEFEVVGVTLHSDASGSETLQTRVHYEIVGIPEGSHRGQLAGQWDLTWTQSPGNEWRVIQWKVEEAERSVALQPLFTDVSAAALGLNPSYARQLRPSIDHWRAVVDDAVGIDVYGHHGVSAGDIDNDGDDDLYVSQPAGLPNRLLRNDGDETFRDITHEAGVAVLDSTSMSLFVDVDNDGDQDLIAITAFRPLLFLNNGKASFDYQPGAFRFSAPPAAQLTSAAVADYDRDGDLDLYVCSYRYHHGAGNDEVPTPYHDANNGPPNFLFRNRGDATFEDVTNSSGMAENNQRYSFAASWEDYDRDGWPDLYVANDFGRNNLYRNQGDGTFLDVAASAGVEDIGAGMSAAWLDYDRDGDLDLFVANYLRFDFDTTPKPGDNPYCFYRNLPVACGPRGLPFDTNLLYRNNGDRTFSDVSRESGISAPSRHYSLGVLTADLNDDGWVDIYVACDRTASLLYLNQRDGTFSEEALLRGVALDENGVALSGMGVAAADFNGDGLLDVFRSNFSDERSTLYRNRGAGDFDETTTAAGMAHNTRFVGWGATFLDFDHDSWKDLLLVNGHVFPEVDRLETDIRYRQRAILYRNLAGRKFSDVSERSGPGILERHAARGLAVGDYDNDGVLEVLINNQNEPPTLLKQSQAPAGNWILLELTGRRSNRAAIGARVRITAGGRTQIDEVRSGGSYLSQSDLRLHFGVGAATTIDQVEILWPSGATQVLQDLQVNQIRRVEEPPQTP